MIEEIKKSISDRERKYRLRDKEKKERYWSSDDNMLTWYWFSLFGECTMMSGMPPLSYLPNLIQSDYTGMKDKNWKEIYEGDVLMPTIKLWHNSWDFMQIVIEWNDNCLAYCIHDWIGWRRWSDRESHTADHFTSWNRVYEYEVVWNIFENPELIQ